MIFIALILNFITWAYGTVTLDGPCPNFSVVENFNMTAFARGLWYEIARYPNDWESSGDCSYIEFIDENNTTNFNIVGVYKKRPHIVNGFVDYAQNADNHGIITLRSASFQGVVEADQIPVYILDVDYDKYIIGMECKYDEINKVRHEYAWIDSKTKVLDTETKKKIDNFISTSKVLNVNNFIWEHFTKDYCDIQA